VCILAYADADLLAGSQAIRNDVFNPVMAIISFNPFRLLCSDAAVFLADNCVVGGLAARLGKNIQSGLEPLVMLVDGTLHQKNWL